MHRKTCKLITNWRVPRRKGKPLRQAETFGRRAPRLAAVAFLPDSFSFSRDLKILCHIRISRRRSVIISGKLPTRPRHFRSHAGPPQPWWRRGKTPGIPVPQRASTRKGQGHTHKGKGDQLDWLITRGLQLLSVSCTFLLGFSVTPSKSRGNVKNLKRTFVVQVRCLHHPGKYIVHHHATTQGTVRIGHSTPTALGRQTDAVEQDARLHQSSEHVLFRLVCCGDTLSALPPASRQISVTKTQMCFGFQLPVEIEPSPRTLAPNYVINENQ